MFDISWVINHTLVFSHLTEQLVFHVFHLQIGAEFNTIPISRSMNVCIYLKVGGKGGQYITMADELLSPTA